MPVKENQSQRSIALFLPTLTPGGIERCFLTLSAGFVERGYDVDLVIAELRGEFQSQVHPQVDLIDLGVDRVLKSFVPLIRYLRSQEPDVLLSGHTHANIVGIWSGKFSRTNTKIAIGVHNPHSRSFGNKNGFSITKFLYPISYARADQVIANSRSVARDLASVINLEGSNIASIYNPIQINRIQKLAEECPNERWFDDYDIIMSAGRLANVKDFQTLIHAFNNLLATRSEIRLVIAGEGEERKKLEKLTNELDLTEKVRFLGYVENPYSYMRAADVYVQSSKWEGFSLTLLEAMACRTSIVSTDCPGGPAEIMENGTYGPLVPVGDPDSLANAIESQLLDPTDPEMLIERAHDFRVESIIEQYEEMLFDSTIYQ